MPRRLDSAAFINVKTTQPAHAITIGEKTNLAASYSGLVAELSAAWSGWNRRNIAPLWHGGSTEDPTAPAGNLQQHGMPAGTTGWTRVSRSTVRAPNGGPLRFPRNNP